MMILKYLYARHLFKRLVFSFGFILLAIFLLYILLDYSVRVQDFLDGKKFSLSNILSYYSLEFVRRSEFLLPLSLLIASLYSLLRLNTAKELVALLASGVSLKNVLKPFWVFATFLVFFQIANQQYFLPAARHKIDLFKANHIKSKSQKHDKEAFQILYLADGSKLIYQKYEKPQYFDVIWVRSMDEVWHMNSLDSSNIKKPEGRLVDIIQRNSQGEMEKKQSFSTLTLGKLPLETAHFFMKKTPVQNRSLTYLGSSLFEEAPYSVSEVTTELLSKLFSCFLPYLILLSLVPLTLKQQRGSPIFFKYALSIFSFFAFLTLVDSLKILSINQVLPAYLTTALPYGLAIIVFGKRYKTKAI